MSIELVLVDGPKTQARLRAVPIREVRIGSRRRGVREDKVKQLAGSISQIGLLNAITVTQNLDLIAGLHRIEACKSLGWTEIAVNFVDGDTLRNELAEVDENLIRNDLTELELGEHLIRRDELLEALGQRAKKGQNQHSGGGEDSAPPQKEVGAESSPTLPSNDPKPTRTVSKVIAPLKTTADIAKEIGISERSAQVSKQIARNIIPEVREVLNDSPLTDKKTELLRLSRIEPERQKRVAEVIAEKQAETVSQAAKIVMREERAAAPEPPATSGLIENTDYTGHVVAGSVDLILTDPPYEISDGSKVTKVGNQVVNAQFGKWDAVYTLEEFKVLMCDWAEEWFRMLRPAGSVVSFMDRRKAAYLWDALEHAGLQVKADITWEKINPNPAGESRRNLNSATEVLLWAIKPIEGVKYTFNEVPGWDRRNIIRTPIISESEQYGGGHPTQKPLSILNPIIQLLSNPGDLVFDPFAGSGSTGVAAFRLKRRYHLIERDGDFFRLAQHRLAKEEQRS